MTAAGTRRFNGRTYYYYRNFHRYDDAVKRAKTLRRQGFLARVVDGEGGSIIYTDPKMG